MRNALAAAFSSSHYTWMHRWNKWWGKRCSIWTRVPPEWEGKKKEFLIANQCPNKFNGPRILYKLLQSNSIDPSSGIALWFSRVFSPNLYPQRFHKNKKPRERETIDIVKTHTTASKIEKKKKLAHSRSLIGNHTTTTTSPVACVWQMQSTFGIELFLPRCHTPNRRYIHIVVDKHITQSSVHTLSTIHLAPLSVFLSIASEIFIFISFLFSYCVLHSIRPITTDSPLSTPA